MKGKSPPLQDLEHEQIQEFVNKVKGSSNWEKLLAEWMNSLTPFQRRRVYEFAKWEMPLMYTEHEMLVGVGDNILRTLAQTLGIIQRSQVGGKNG